MKLDFLPGLKTALGGVFLLLSLVAPGLFSDEEAQMAIEAVTQAVGAFLVVYGLVMKAYRYFKGLDQKMEVMVD